MDLGGSGRIWVDLGGSGWVWVGLGVSGLQGVDASRAGRVWACTCARASPRDRKPTCSGLQPHAIQAAIPRSPGCSPVRCRLQPCARQAAALCAAGYNPMLQTATLLLQAATLCAARPAAPRHVGVDVVVGVVVLLLLAANEGHLRTGWAASDAKGCQQPVEVCAAAEAVRAMRAVWAMKVVVPVGGGGGGDLGRPHTRVRAARRM